MPEPGYSRDRDGAPSKRNSITDRLLGSFNQGRKDTTSSVQRRASSVNKQSPVLRIREWLDKCNGEHDHHCSGGTEDNIATWRPLWLIDSVERKLVRANPTDRYLALSYVWGAGSRRNTPEVPVQLLRSNLDAFQQQGLPEADLPQTILDAMWLSKKLGLRHLWVDRLCIVQDDEQEMDNHVRHMAYIFSNAYLTIVAAHGDVHTGLLPLNPRRATRPGRSGARDHNDLLLGSKWNTRAWTLQELLYSRRAIFFFEEAITWECHCELWQGNPTSMLKSIRGNRHVCTNPLSSSVFGFQHAPWPDMDDYARIASDYSARRVTLVDDSLRAFTGITQVLSRVFPGGFIYGMPIMFLDVALLWRPSASLRRRAVPRPPFLPSWSWMGWWFDGVPVDLTLWKAAADYVEEAKVAKRGQASKRFQPSHPFKIRPTIQWNLTDRVASVPVANTGFQFRDLRGRKSSSAALPPGWLKAGSHFKHDSDDSTVFKYPIPVEDPPEADEYEPPLGEMAYPGPFLSFKTTAGFFEVDFALTLSPKDRLNPPIAVGNIWSRSNKWIGEFRAHDGWLGVQTSNYDGEEKLEFVAISTATERRGSHVFNVERFEENMDEDEMVDIVNVLWVERIGGVAYRRGLGHILQRAWDSQSTTDVDILLGAWFGACRRTCSAVPHVMLAGVGPVVQQLSALADKWGAKKPAASRSMDQLVDRLGLGLGLLGLDEVSSANGPGVSDSGGDEDEGDSTFDEEDFVEYLGGARDLIINKVNAPNFEHASRLRSVFAPYEHQKRAAAMAAPRRDHMGPLLQEMLALVEMFKAERLPARGMDLIISQLRPGIGLLGSDEVPTTNNPSAPEITASSSRPTQHSSAPENEISGEVVDSTADAEEYSDSDNDENEDDITFEEEDFIDFLQGAHDTIIEKLKAPNFKHVSRLRSGFLPYEHQKRAAGVIAKANESGFNGILLADPPALGKTLSSLLVPISEHTPGQGPVIVIAPNSCTQQWVDEISKMYGESASVLLLKGDSVSAFKLFKYTAVVASYHHVAAELGRLTRFVQRIDAVRKGKSRHLPKRPTVALLSGIWEMEGAKPLSQYLILDEAHTIKNARTRMYAAVAKLRSHCKFCIMLAGTPLDNTWIDSFAYLSLLDSHSITSLARMKLAFTG
ncbi:hypothetical protein S7711_09502 [Stachybotrys chartarum IBT 7711]|uniref:Helicase ATP-binding domain-containing protein n=1 Tax=Stachybotrys chartarum (strain CBS 109288 / IBT 7711) TaxID=1280523 RepID=A0A084ANE0_STACB|nr:hypothetical protein S7711_09502 [Stachybotrys chartarum IBT 7711]